MSDIFKARSVLTYYNNQPNKDYYFSEIHDTNEIIEQELSTIEFKILYDSIEFSRADSGYNIIKYGYNKDTSYHYLAISLNGCSLASALTEYLRFRSI